TAGFVHTGADGYGNGVFTYPNRQVNITLSKTGQSFIGSEVLGDEGTITIGFIVEMKDIFLVTKDGQKERVVRNYTRDELMGAEARSFLNTIVEFEKFEKDYRHLQQQTLAACSVLETMHKNAGICFPQP
ncbi:MAG: hypothetical protein WCP73_07865, partial [Eubacteriales bacterium]